MMRQSLFLGIALLLAGCSASPLAPSAGAPAPAPEDLFVLGLEQGLTSGDVQALERLQSTFPDSPWAPRAQGLHQALEEKRLLMGELEALRETNARLSREILLLEEGKTREYQERVALERRILHLQEDLEKLSQLLIETERRAH
ncbi:MAG: hypothetical protein C0617_02910 [Desulfuromonas sp.]|uniref:hypothetical protein n=1 Tax=Desulfuromonas sp. TaxID=892 RepID=UPI000CB5B959|nr:hypothetical protein [Desulfuromonas sp.]PLX85834.1 MAG: hypothetical protein C0617_02910 [Desulfuromonas sp.]